MTNAEKGKLLADKLRARKLKNRGETYSSLPFLEQAVDAAIEAAALVAENGGKLVDIINAVKIDCHLLYSPLSKNNIY